MNKRSRPASLGIWIRFATMGKNKTKKQDAKPKRLEPKELPGGRFKADRWLLTGEEILKVVSIGSH